MGNYANSIRHCAVSAALLLGLLLSNTSNGATPAQPDDTMRQLLQQTIAESDSFDDRFDAEVWMVDMDARLKRYVKDPEERLHILRLAHREARRVDLQPEIILSVMHVESLFDRFAISRVGAQGIMQIMPFWKNELGDTHGTNLMNIETNIRYGCTILKAYLKREKGSMIRALARYNGSVGKTWYSEKVFNAWKRYWFVKKQ